MSKRHSQPISLEDAIAPGRLERDLQRDQLVRWSLILLIPTGVAVLFARHFNSENAMTLWMLLVSGAWVAVSLINANVWRSVMQMEALLARGHESAVTQLLDGLRRLPLHRAVRIMIYHRLAVVLHQQGLFYHVIGICQQVLSETMGSAEQVRSHILLLLVESRLAVGDLYGAYLGLLELSRRRLRLVESLQRLGLQTRYLVSCGYDEVALYDLKQTIRMSELMPSAQCGAMHALLGIAAQRSEQTSLTQWLQQRASLLCEPKQLEQLVGEGRFVSEVNATEVLGATKSV